MDLKKLSYNREVYGKVQQNHLRTISNKGKKMLVVYVRVLGLLATREKKFSSIYTCRKTINVIIALE